MLNISPKRVEPDISENEIQSLKTLSTHRTGRKLARWIVGILSVLFIVLFMPWQQNINGTGTVTALTPQDRPQTVQNIIAGRIEKWHVREGQAVQKGDTILTLSEIKDEYFDPNLPLRLTEQVDAKETAVDGYENKIEAVENQLAALRNALRLSLEKARNKVLQAQAKVQSDSVDLANERIQFRIAEVRFERFQQGYQQGLFSKTDLEGRELTFQAAQAKVVSAQNKLNISRQDLINSRIELSSIDADYQKEIAKSLSDRSSAVSSLGDGQKELSELRNKVANVNVRRNQYVLRAPQSGVVVKALKAGVGETIKEGEPICTLQPQNPQMAVELYIKAMDVPLIQKGREVRIQFDGWPALQFSGWPSVSVGTFGGRVAVIDQVNSTSGEYRILVTEKVEERRDHPWPAQLRLGSGVYGWVMLDSVPVWYEIWRQLNGFPPSLKEEPKGDFAGKGAKK
ncbi:biotin attachment protein [Siphonobacter sp. BAB-5385]|uniref:HlyD family secretion protein n=1 Tax=Siphonobacter sp. BAB-5385 TaxID=1864822 RepID=UPI000B9EDD0C|nr:HlyD family efflux transporter periplasmic adaptor subunit [Siphonobacter sp. BAB-5385]OZI09826.1 biotin attachment protein [Siphonobacter sp. BAB-5385]